MSLDEHPPSLERPMPPVEPAALPPLPWVEGIEVVMARYERRILDHALAQAGNVKRRAAMLLGISRYALERRLTRVARVLDVDLPAAQTPSAEARFDDEPPAQEQASIATGEG